MKRTCFGIAAAFAVLACAPAQADVSGYAHRLAFTVSGYSGAPLRNFPMLVRLYEKIDGFSYSGFLSEGGADLRFTLADGTELAHEIEKWDSSGRSCVWVKVPELSAGMQLVMHWGKAGDVAPSGSVFGDSGLWTALHLDETDGIYADATGNNHTGANASKEVDGVAYTPQSIDGLIGGAARISGLGQNAKGPAVLINSYATSGISDTFSFSLWFRYAGTGAVADDCIIGSADCRVELCWGAPANMKILDPGCSWISENVGGVFSPAADDGGWHHLAVTFSGTTALVYVNGELKKSHTLKASMAQTGKALAIGNNQNLDRPAFKGDVDEFRLAAGLLSADWIAAEYAMAAESEKFLSLYDERICVVPPGTPGVSPEAPYDTWETAATNLETAVAAATVSAPVVVRPGTYAISAALTIGDGIAIRSANASTGLPDPGNTVIDASAMFAPGPAVLMTGAGTLDGFTVSGAGSSSLDGGAMKVSAGKAARVANCIFRDNIARYGGGVLLESPSRCTFSNCVFAANAAQRGGAAYYGRSGEFADLPLFESCSFRTNRTTVSWGQGAAVWAGASRFVGCSFDANTAYDGQCYERCVYPSAGLTLLGCSFRNHGETTYGASCLYLRADEALEVSGCVFSGNGRQTVFGSNVQTFRDCIFTNNADGAVKCCPRMRNCLVVNNTGVGVVHNMANNPAFIDNCTITGNGGYGVQGNASGGHVVVRNSIVTGNTTYDYATWKEDEYLYATNSVIGTVKIAAADPGACDSVWTFNPRFADAASGDFHLAKRSPCLDAGIVLDWMDAGATDLDGNPRRIDGFGVASTSALPDLGCYERQDGSAGLKVIFK